jgi:hypothetical protein
MVVVDWWCDVQRLLLMVGWLLAELLFWWCDVELLV